MLVVNQLVDNIQEVLIPLVKTYRLNRDYQMSRKKSDLLPTIARIKYEKQLPAYEVLSDSKDNFCRLIRNYLKLGHIL